MKNRRAFLSAVAGTGVGVALVSADTPAKAQPRSPSPAAVAAAAAFRAFDAKLTDAELRTIARRIDENRAAARALGAVPRRLHNGDDSIARFGADEPLAT